MKVLLVSQAFPPYPVVGALRADKLANALRAHGHQVHIVTERLQGEDDRLRIDEPGLQVHTVALKPPYRLRLVSLLRRLRPTATRESRRGDAGAGAVAAPERGSSNGSRPGLLRRAILSLLWLPDDELRFVPPALRVARRLMREEHIDVVYTTSPPHSSHLIGLRLRRTSPVRWVAELRDPWTDQRDPVRIPHWFGPVEAVHRWLERRCLHHADVVVAVTEGARQRLAEKLPAAERGKFMLAVNGIDQLMPSDAARPDGPFRIVYSGTFYHSRDPRPLLDALARLRRRRGLTQADISVDLVGRCRTYDEDSVEAMVADRGLADVVHFHDWMPQADAQAMARDADLLILIAHDQPLQVPNKLFDYLGTRRRILAILDEEGESARMLRQIGGHHIVAVHETGVVDSTAIERAIEAAYDAMIEGHSTPSTSEVGEATLQGWLSSRQMQHLVEVISA